MRSLLPNQPSVSPIDALAVRNLTKRFDAITAVDDVNLSLERGKILALLGPSGCGKTTLLRLIAGFEIPDTGAIKIGERMVVGPDTGNLPPEQRRIGMVFQDYALFPHLTVAQNIAYGLPRGGEREARVSELLDLVGLSGSGKRMPHQLSGGQQQRVALARALAPRPALMLLDEPFSNLDAGLRRQVRGEVQRILAAEHVAAVFVTHDQEEALSMADSVAVMLAGKVLQLAAPREVYEQPANREVASFVGAANFLPAQAEGMLAQTVLGPLPLRKPAYGTVDLLIRPEMLRVVRDPAAQHHVIDRSYFGVDQSVMLRLSDGTIMQARLPSWDDFSANDPVRLSVQHALMAYQAE